MVGFPDGTSDIIRCAETFDTFFAELVVRGSNTGQLVLPDGTTVPPTGRAVVVPSAEVVVFRDSKVGEHHVYYDLLGLLAQLDVGAA